MQESFFLNNLTEKISEKDLSQYILMISNSQILIIRILKNTKKKFFGFILFANFQILGKFHLINDVKFQIERSKN